MGEERQRLFGHREERGSVLPVAGKKNAESCVLLRTEVFIISLLQPGSVSVNAELKQNPAVHLLFELRT